MSFIRHAVLLVLIVAAAGIAFMYSGLYNVSAQYPHRAIPKWILHTTMERSVAYHARDIQAPDLEGRERLREGVEEYEEMCVGCHGAPGVKPGHVAEGLRPEPPELDHAAEEWTPAELFWIIKHGVRMTGMPAWGPTHEDGELWAVVALVERFPQMAPAAYEDLRAQVRRQDGNGQHQH
ncbi:c-type cytochrome [Thiohalorhabdus methylotrophus]|uniref:Cytochrome c n=1 Tax=Thiohalorhabdus methylotrophus TaxID=3242694 RepID=A0ABV4TS62_9GAMM